MLTSAAHLVLREKHYFKSSQVFWSGKSRVSTVASDVCNKFTIHSSLYYVYSVAAVVLVVAQYGVLRRKFVNTLRRPETIKSVVSHIIAEEC